MAGLACVAALSMVPAPAPGAQLDRSVRRSLSLAALMLLALLMVAAIASLLTMATTMFGGMIAWSRVLYSGPFPLVHAPARVAVAATPLVVIVLCYREWGAMRRPGVGSPLVAAVAVCIAVIIVGATVGTVLDAWTSLAQLLRIRGQWQANPPILNWTALPELLALLVLPWLLRFMPSAPSSTPAPAEPPTHGPSPATRIAFDRGSA